jgi:hypothetical protein
MAPVSPPHPPASLQRRGGKLVLYEQVTYTPPSGKEGRPQGGVVGLWSVLTGIKERAYGDYARSLLEYGACIIPVCNVVFTAIHYNVTFFFLFLFRNSFYLCTLCRDVSGRI